MSFEYLQGQQHAKDRSIHYNPYRNLPAEGRFGEWQEGWEAAQSEWQRRQNFEPRHNVVN